jgi:zinc-binding alcohol dehydrogenase/oxidoreductase
VAANAEDLMRLVLSGPPGRPTIPRLVDDDDGSTTAEPKPGEVIVDVEWAGLNRIDRLLADGHVPRPDGEHVLGGQGAGAVASIGAGVRGLRPGQLVALYPYGGCGGCEGCASGNETLCRTARLDGVNAPGTFQSRFAAVARDAYPAPAPLTPQAAVLAPTLAVAWHVLVCRGGLQPGETVAVSTISSGLGACCGALAAWLGASVVGVARAGTLARLVDLPAWVGETWATDDPKPGRRPPRVDLAVDAVGAPTIPIVHRMVRTGGRMVTVGAHAGRECTLDLWRLLTREQDLRGSHGCHRADMEHALDALPGLDPATMIDSVFDIRDHADAYRRLDTPGRLGNVLLRVGDGAW